jgi:hypothetical protein
LNCTRPRHWKRFHLTAASASASFLNLNQEIIGAPVDEILVGGWPVGVKKEAVKWTASVQGDQTSLSCLVAGTRVTADPTQLPLLLPFAFS